MNSTFMNLKIVRLVLNVKVRNSHSCCVHISDCFDSDKQNIVTLSLIFICLQVIKCLKLRKHTFKNIGRFSSP